MNKNANFVQQETRNRYLKKNQFGMKDFNILESL